MIRYPNALKGIRAELGDAWLQKARERTAVFKKRSEYTEGYIDTQGAVQTLLPFWGDVKEIYIKRQHNKCIYRETQLEGDNSARVQWDLEHFRPKGNVRVWPSPKSGLRRKYANIPTGGAACGYYMLAYAHANYAAACKTCNSPFKSDYFPIASARIQAGSNPSTYAAENAYLIYPLGPADADPSDLIAFEGITAVAKYNETQDHAKWQRANLIIDFFKLNRQGLMRKRAHWLYLAVWPWIKLADKDDVEAIQNLKFLRTEKMPYSNCVACFIDLCAANRVEAEKHVKICKQIIKIDK